MLNGLYIWYKKIQKILQIDTPFMRTYKELEIHFVHPKDLIKKLAN